MYYYNQQNNLNNNNQTALYSGVDLSPNYNPLDWMPSYRVPFNLSSYMTILNAQLISIKIYVECCQLFCVTFIDSFDDGYSNVSDNRRRVFVDINLRNYLFLDSASMNPSTKKCMISDLYSQPNNGTLFNSTADQYRSLNMVTNCGIDAPFKTFPLKNTCRNELSQYCGMNNFGSIIQRFYPPNYSGTCNQSLLCLNVTSSSSDDLKAACGASLSQNFMTNSFRISYTGIAYPCHNPAIAQAPVQATSFIQAHLMKSRLGQVNSTSGYVDESTLTPSEQNEVVSTVVSVQSNGNLTVAIDGNTNTAPNTNVAQDLNNINANIQVNNSTNYSSTFMISMISYSVLAIFILLL